MRKIITLSFIFAAIMSGWAQTDSTTTTTTTTKTTTGGEDEVVIDGKRMRVVIKDKEKVIIKDGDTTIIREADKIEIDIKDDDEMDEDWVEGEDEDGDEFEFSFGDDDEDEGMASFDFFSTKFGLNNLLNTNDKFDMPVGHESMELTNGRSMNFELMFATHAVKIFRDNLRFIYGIGIDYNNYRFTQNVNLSREAEGPLLGTIDSLIDYKKNKLVTQYLTVPLLLNINLGPEGDEKFNLTFGPSFGYLIGSHQKQKWEDGSKEKRKIKDGYHLEDWRIGYQASIGYSGTMLYAKYFPNPVFQANQGPDVRTVAFGISFSNLY